MIVNLPITLKKCYRTTLWNAEFNCLMEGILNPSKRWWVWKEPVVLCGNLNVRQATSQQVFKVTTFCMDTRFQSFSPLISRIIHHTVLTHVLTSHCCKSSVSRIGTWYTHSCIMPQMQDWRLGTCQDWWTGVYHGFTAQKLDCVMSVMCWCIVLLEDRIQTRPLLCCWSLAAALVLATRLDSTVHWFSPQVQQKWGWYSRVNDTATEITTGLLKVGSMHRRCRAYWLLGAAVNAQDDSPVERVSSWHTSTSGDDDWCARRMICESSSLSGDLTHWSMSARSIFLTEDEISDSVDIVLHPRTSPSPTTHFTAVSKPAIFSAKFHFFILFIKMHKGRLVTYNTSTTK